MEGLWLGLALGFAIGGSLGLLGGGGSILTVPALVYLLGQSPQVAVMTSLAIVGANSAMGAFFHRARGALNWRVALLFGGAGMVAAYPAAILSRRLSPDVLMVAFAGLMLVIGLLLLLRRPGATVEVERLSLTKILLAGAAVGLLTGILGVGGGFLIVPALALLGGLPMVLATGTSLVIIALNATTGLAVHLVQQPTLLGALDWPVLGAIAAVGALGSLAGRRLAGRLDDRILRRAFAAALVVLAFVVLRDALPEALVCPLR